MSFYHKTNPTADDLKKEARLDAAYKLEPEEHSVFVLNFDDLALIVRGKEPAVYEVFARSVSFRDLIGLNPSGPVLANEVEEAREWLEDIGGRPFPTVEEFRVTMDITVPYLELPSLEVGKMWKEIEEGFIEETLLHD